MKEKQQRWWFIRPPAAGSDLCKFPSRKRKRKHSKAVGKKKEKERRRNKNEENISCGFWAKSKQRPFFSPAVADARVQKQQVFRFSGLQQLASFPFPSKWLSTRAPNDGSCCCASSSWSSTPLYHHHPVTTTTTTWPALRFVRPIAPEDCPTETSHNLSYLSQVRMKKTKTNRWYQFMFRNKKNAWQLPFRWCDEKRSWSWLIRQVMCPCCFLVYLIDAGLSPSMARRQS